MKTHRLTRCVFCTRVVNPFFCTEVVVFVKDADFCPIDGQPEQSFRRCAVKYPAMIRAEGLWGPRSIQYVRQPRPDFPSDAEGLIASCWDAELAKNPNLTPGPMLALTEVRDHSAVDTLQCILVQSDYRRFMGTTRMEFGKRWPKLVMPSFAALGVLVSSDGMLILGHRSSKIDYGGLYHAVPACRVTPDQRDAFSAIYIEAKEELGLEPNEISDVICVGVVSDMVWGRLNNEFVFYIRSTLTFAEIQDRAQTAKSANEHDRLIGLVWNESKDVSDFLHLNARNMVPTGFAAVALAMRHMFGALAFPGWSPCHMTYEEFVRPVL